MTKEQERALAEKRSKEAQAEAKRVNAGHTPGPWFTHREGFSTVYIEARIGGGWVQEIAACGPASEGSEQQDANARLIAAAPELLEALQAAVGCSMVPKSRAAEGGAASHSIQAHVADQIRAAIAKATGTPPPSDKGAETP